ncbi:MAG: DNA-directed RNA polymerase subunit omega [Clostridia bacterium]|nr:DNA-directed RNA polymerase subunit omega [Clostridia bacterium]
MMLQPAIGNLVEKAGSRYALVIAVAKRARDLSEEEDIRSSSKKPVSMAVQEIADGNILIDCQ